MSNEEHGRQYPIVVEETRRYVLWLDADSSAEAVELFDGEPYDPGHETLYWFNYETRVPDRYDWDNLQYAGDGSWPGMMADAHVRTHEQHIGVEKRRRLRAACAERGHPGAEYRMYARDRYCRTCGWLNTGLAETVTVAGGVL